MIYLDNSATTKQYDEVTELVYKVSKETFGNPSSLHAAGFEASKLLKKARAQTGALLPSGGSLIFTSGGTESDNMALISSAAKMKKRGNKIITTAVEHPAVTETCKRLAQEGFVIEYLPVDERGCIKVEDMSSALGEDVVLVSAMSVNNETGSIFPINEIADSISKFNKANGREIIFHTDAVQAYGKLDLTGCKADLISASAHKFHGPKGVGLLHMRDGLKIPPFITGGRQEGGMRSSTENTTGIAGMGLAAEISARDMQSKIRKIAEVSEYLREGMMSEIADIKINGAFEVGYSMADFGMRYPSVLNLTFEGTRGEVLLHTLEQDGIYVSTGSACSSNHSGESPVLKAMGLTPKQIEGAIRFSFSEFNTKEEMDFVIDRTKAAVERFRKLGSYQ
ncbi:MAG: cysteine desulfurase [Mogibacterium sp.]|nr:cysteine desulfurase [Mogibacterium sp.]